MKVKIDFLPEFMRLAKPLWKKYASFEQDYMSLLDELRSNPFVGTFDVNLRQVKNIKRVR